MPVQYAGANAVSRETARGLVLMTAIGYSFMGIAFAFIDWNPLCIAAIRSALTIPLLMLFSHKVRVHISRANACGALFSFLASTLFIVANKFTSATNAIVLQYTNPLFVMLYCVVFLHEKMKRKDMLLLFVALSGMVLFFIDDLSAKGMFGNLMALLSGMMMAAVTLYGRYSKTEMTDYIILSHEMTVAVCGVFCFLAPPRITAVSLGSAAFMAVFCVTLPHLFFRVGVRQLPPVETSVLLMLDPILNPLWVALIARQKPTILAMAGAVLVILSVAYWCITPDKTT